MYTQEFLAVIYSSSGQYFGYFIFLGSNWWLLNFVSSALQEQDTVFQLHYHHI
jgi:hypothetical protein